MSDILFVISIIAVWIVLQMFVFPKLGVYT